MAKDINPRIKIAFIAGAAKALDYKDTHPKATMNEVMQNVTKDIKHIIDEIEREEYSS